MANEPLNNKQIEPYSPLQNGGQALPINTTGSKPFSISLEAPESPRNADIPVSLNNPNPENTPILTENPEAAIPLEPTDMRANPASNGTSEPSVEPVVETRTAQMAGNEPFAQPKISLARELLISTRNAIQFRKRKKLDRMMSLFLQKSKITNDEVREFLHVSDATATRYLSQLEQEGKIKQNGKTGHAVSYSRI